MESSSTNSPNRVTVSLRIDSSESLSAQLISRLDEACDCIEDTGRPALLLLRLSGRAMRSSEQPWPGNVDIHTVNKWEQALRRVERLDAVTVSIADGICQGAAMELLLVTDYKLATTDAVLRVSNGSSDIWPGIVLYRIARQLGVSRSRRLLLSGKIAAADAAFFGLVDEVIANTDGAEAAIEAALRPLDLAQFAVHRRLMLDGLTMSYNDALGAHLAACDRQLRYRRSVNGVATSNA